MRTIILQNSKDTPPGNTTNWLEKHGFPYKIIELFSLKKLILPSLEDFDFLVVCGGAMNVDQEDKYPWLTPEKKLIKEAIIAKKHVLGLCLGGQLIAEALGARVGKHAQWETGWQDVNISPVPNSVLLKEQTLKSFQFHGYSFDTPKGAQRFASSTACAHQGYIFEDLVVGFQFHPETTVEWATECANEPDLPQGPYCQTKNQMIEDSKFQPMLQNWYFDFLTNWLVQKK